MKTTIFISLLLLLALSPAAARACQCMAPTLESSLAVAADAALVAEGAVTAVRFYPDGEPMGYAEADVAVGVVAKGDAGIKTVTFRYQPESMPLGGGAFTGNSCGLSYMEGQSGRFVLSRDEGGVYRYAGFCALITDEAWQTLLAEKNRQEH